MVGEALSSHGILDSTTSVSFSPQEQGTENQSLCACVVLFLLTEFSNLCAWECPSPPDKSFPRCIHELVTNLYLNWALICIWHYKRILIIHQIFSYGKITYIFCFMNLVGSKTQPVFCLNLKLNIIQTLLTKQCSTVSYTSNYNRSFKSPG